MIYICQTYNHMYFIYSVIYKVTYILDLSHFRQFMFSDHSKYTCLVIVGNIYIYSVMLSILLTTIYFLSCRIECRRGEACKYIISLKLSCLHGTVKSVNERPVDRNIHPIRESNPSISGFVGTCQG